ncbi:hypothetical protein [Pararhodospirillum photometricum]|uniref:Uncharacterized protein n=1 Tax=Pararhodospirillum photometricum DSM 122 TaxID=1150469 RepID=H6SRH2_PARPM|nr:hypothetical protein [Pararhodospirillum photometricum]CCG07501.1 Putative uncharacterized protein [Pararhodospirillum photometricum DSM 122]
MASYMIKVAGEGLVNQAHRNSDAGPTTGSSVIYEVINVPAGVSADDVVALIKKDPKNIPHNTAYEVEYTALAG